MVNVAAGVAIDGMCDSRLQCVRDAFAENFALHGEVGATVAVTVGGKLVVDLWAGHADAVRAFRCRRRAFALGRRVPRPSEALAQVARWPSGTLTHTSASHTS